MGMSSNKTKQTNAPSDYSRPYIDAGAGALQAAYGQSNGLALQVSNSLGSQLPGLATRAFTPSAGVTAATDYNTDVLGGKYLDASNPYLSAMVDQNGADVRSRVQAQFSQAGRTGSGANQYALARGLGSAENALRYQNYGDERARMGSAASLAPSLEAAQYAGINPYLSVAQSAVGLPLSTAQQYSGALGSLMTPYNTQTGTQSQGLGGVLGQVAGAGLAGWASGGFSLRKR